MHRITRLILLAPFLVVPSALAQSQPAPYDITPVIRQLSEPGPGGYDAALAKAKALPAAAIVPIWDYLADNSHSFEVRKDLTTALESIYSRERASRAAADQAAALQWLTATSVDIYKKSANNPPVDALVLRAFDDANANRPDAEKSLKAAIDAGSPDPLLRFFYLSRTHRGRATAADNTRLCARLLADFNKSSYPAGRKLFANLLYLQCAVDVGTPSLLTDDQKLELLNRALAFFPDYLAERPSDSQIRQSLDTIYRRALDMKGGRDHEVEALVLIEPALSQALPGSPLLHALEATAYVESTRYAPTKWNKKGRPEDRQRYQTAVDRAQAALEKGWRIDPLNVDCPTLMIAVAKTKFLDRRTMETWFSRAMLADPHNFQACSNKMDYLSPDWQGSDEDCLEFARFCAKYGNGADRIPTILITYYEILKEKSDLRDAYMHSPEVWKDLRIAYETLLADQSRLTSDRKRYLNDRGAYIQAACDCDQWQEAKRLLDLFSPDIGYDDTKYKGAPPELFKREIETKAAR